MQKMMFLSSVLLWYNDYKYHGSPALLSSIFFFPWKSSSKYIQADYALMCVTTWAG